MKMRAEMVLEPPVLAQGEALDAFSRPRGEGQDKTILAKDRISIRLQSKDV